MPKSFDFRDVADLRKVCYSIHAFGLGFIQIKLTPEYRIHLYSDEVRQTTEPEDVHDHRYGFTSTIMRGGLTNDIFRAAPDYMDGEFTVSEVTCKPGSSEDGQRLFDCNLFHVGSFSLNAGSLYTLAADTFHRVSAQDGTITILHREPPSKEFARVARRRGQAPVCPFSANVLSEDELWRIYERAVAQE